MNSDRPKAMGSATRKRLIKEKNEALAEVRKAHDLGDDEAEYKAYGQYNEAWDAIFKLEDEE
tara:strand:+ start:93 stop:278 length:186 start_codon:yes stop_codon:yes gene_type:complete